MSHERPIINWIPVEKELPDEEDFEGMNYVPCVCTIHIPDIEQICLAYYKKDGKFHDVDTNEQIDSLPGDKITAWCKIPETYKEG